MFKKNKLKDFFQYITRPKITIYLKSGNVVKTRVFPVTPHAVGFDGLRHRIVNQEMSDICGESNRECVCIRAWWEKWG